MIKLNSIVCGNIVYTYSFFEYFQNRQPKREISSDFFDSLFDSTPRYLSVDSYMHKKNKYRDYLSSFDDLVRDKSDFYSSFLSDPALIQALSTGFYKLQPSFFGLYDVSRGALSRSSRRLRDYVYCNVDESVGGLFLTLTYRTPMFDSRLIKKHQNLFIKRLKYRLSSNFRYIIIPEKHISDKTRLDRYGSYHFHLLIFDINYIDNKLLTETWSFGFCYIKRLYGGSSRIAQYVAKYLTKDMSIDSGRRFTVSRNCFKPQPVSDLSTLPPLVALHTSTYTTLSGEKLFFTVNKKLES